MLDAIFCWAAKRSSIFRLQDALVKAEKRENERLSALTDNLRTANANLTRGTEVLLSHTTQTEGARDLMVWELKRRRQRLRELGETEWCRNWEPKAKAYRKAMEDLVDNRPAAEIAASQFAKEVGGSLAPGTRIEAYSSTTVSGGPGVSRTEEGHSTVQVEGGRDVE